MSDLVSRRAGWRRMAGVALALAAASLHAEVTLAPLFTDGAVLQCDKPVPVWGTATPGEALTVSFGGQTRAATAAADGRWIAVLDAQPPTAQGADLTVTAKDGTRVVHDVVVGEVWLCAGESNMELPVRDVTNAEREVAAAQYPLIRHVRIEHQMAATPMERVGTSGWKPATPANVGAFTAVGYFFARDLYVRLHVPVGIVHSSWGGTPIEAWMSPAALASDPAFAVAAQRWQESVAAYPMAKSVFDAESVRWAAGAAAAKARGEKIYAQWWRQNLRPLAPLGGPDDAGAPAGLFNGMINPLLPYAWRGVLWYQGESNAARPEEYHARFAALITAWRAHFGQGPVPFYWVNLPAFRAGDATDVAWARLREAQTQTLALPNTAQAVAIDLGDPNDIHPRFKQEVSRRLALLAKRRVYGLVADDQGPTFVQAKAEGRAMRVTFREAGSGLIAHDKPPQALELAGPDHVFHPAAGRIDHETLLVSSPQVREPVAVRYAWHNAPDANLYGGNGLPVVPFRSDAW